MSSEILSQLGVGVVVIDLNKKIRYANKALEELFQISSKQMIGMYYEDRTLPWEQGRKEGINRPALEAMQTGKIIQQKIELTFFNQTYKYLCFSAPLRNNHKMIIGAIDVYVAIEQDDFAQSIFPIIKKYVSNNSWNHIVSKVTRKQTPTFTKCFVTIAFIDIVGFSTMAEKLEPDQTVAILNVFFDRIHKTISHYKGDIDKYLGDAVLATFFNAESALRCFTDVLLTELPIVNQMVQRITRNAPPISVHIGINSGWVIMGEVGAINRKELTVIGDDVNTAARIQALTPPNEIWVSSRTVANIGDFKNLLKEADYIKVKGKTLKIKVYKFDPADIELNSRVVCYDKEESNIQKIKSILNNRGVHSIISADSIEKLDKLLNKECDTIILGPSVPPKELLAIKQIMERVGLKNDILIPIAKNVHPDTVESLERLGIKTFIPASEGKQFEDNLANVIRTQKINKILPKKNIDEVDDYVATFGSEPESENKDIVLEQDSSKSLSDSIIYKKETNRLETTIKKVLNQSQIHLLTSNILKIWEYDYHSKQDIDIVFNLDSVIKSMITEDYIKQLSHSIFKESRLQEKGWSRGYLIFKSNNPETERIVSDLMEDFRVKYEGHV